MEPKIVTKYAQEHECIYIKGTPRYLEFECGHTPNRLVEIVPNIKAKLCDECLKRQYAYMIDFMPNIDENFKGVY